MGPNFMPKFLFTITAPATVSTIVEVEADTIEAAHALAVTPSFIQSPERNLNWELDGDNMVRDVYVPDEEDYEVLPSPGL